MVGTAPQAADSVAEAGLARAKADYQKAFEEYTRLVTTGGDGDVEAALSRYRVAHSRYKQLQAEIPMSSQVAAALSPDPRLAAAEKAVFDVLERFRETCFGSVVSLGTPEKYAKAFSIQDLVIEDGTTLAISTLNKRGAGAALADQTNLWKAPLPNMMFLPFKLPISAVSGPLTKAQKSSVWHEATHQIEALHGDRQTVEFAQHPAYRERNTAYLDAALIALQDLADVERHMQRRNEMETDAEWEEWKRLDGRPAIESVGDRLRAVEKGIATQEALRSSFRPGDVKVWPPDLRQLEAWTGVHISWDAIVALYDSEACGPSLKREMERAGTWKLVNVSRQDTPRDDDQLRDRGWFAEPTYGDGSFSTRIGGSSGAWGGSATMTWTTPAASVHPGEKITITLTANATNTKEHFVSAYVFAMMTNNPAEDSSPRVGKVEWVMPPGNPAPINITVWSRASISPSDIWSIWGLENITYT